MNGIFKKHSILSLVLVIVLIAAMALSVVSCDKEDLDNEETTAATEAVTTEAVTTEEAKADNVVGKGDTSFEFTVVFVDGSSKTYTVKTDKTTVGEALLDAGLIAGEDSQYGLYVKTVDGVTHDYNADGKYWAFYVDGQYAMSGVDTTNIEAGKSYSFKVE